MSIQKSFFPPNLRWASSLELAWSSYQALAPDFLES